MAKHKTSFTVTITTDETYSARKLASAVRDALKKLVLFDGPPKCRKEISVVKVTVDHIGEK